MIGSSRPENTGARLLRCPALKIIVGSYSHVVRLNKTGVKIIETASGLDENRFDQRGANAEIKAESRGKKLVPASRFELLTPRV